MNIAIFSSLGGKDMGGWGRITHDLCNYLNRNNIKFELFLPKNHPVIKNDYSHKINYILPDFVTSFQNPKIFSYLLKKIKYDFSNFDIIHAETAFPHCYSAYRVAKKYNKPLIISVAGTYGVAPLLKKIDSYYLQKAYNYATKIIALSNFTRDKIIQFSKIDSSKIAVITGSIDTKYLNSVKSESINQLVKKKFILSVGEFKPRKGYANILASLSAIFEIDRDVIYVHAGKNSAFSFDDYPGLKEYGERIFFLGKVSEAELMWLYKNCHFYVQTPINDNWNFEGFGLVFLEANLFEKPVIGSRSGGVPDAIQDLKTGLICYENDILDLEKKMILLNSDLKLYANLKKNCKQWALDHDVNIILAKVKKIYESIINLS